MIIDQQLFYLGNLSSVSIVYPSTLSNCVHSTYCTACNNEVRGTARAPELQLIDRIENAQLDGTLPMQVGETALVKLNIDQYGMKVSALSTGEIIERNPLRNIFEAVAFDDGLGHFNIGVTTSPAPQFDKQDIFKVYVFQSLSQEQAENICQALQSSFTSITPNNS